MRYYLANPIPFESFNPATYVSPYQDADSFRMPHPDTVPDVRATNNVDAPTDSQRTAGD